MNGPSDRPPGPRIPAPPPADERRRARRGDARWLIWLGALGVGVAAGVCAYQWLPPIDTTFDYWLALALG